MEKKKTPWMSLILQGTGIGFPVLALCAVLSGGWNEMTVELVTWVVASALFGVVSGLFLHKLTLSMPVAIGLHFVCCLAIALGACMICGYTDDPVSLLLGVLPVFLVVYAVVWVICYRAMKREAKRINDTLDAKAEKE